MNVEVWVVLLKRVRVILVFSSWDWNSLSGISGFVVWCLMVMKVVRSSVEKVKFVRMDGEV